MSHEMSTFFTGVRRNPPDRVARTRTGARPGAGATGATASARGGASTQGGGSPPARRNRRQQGGGAAGAARAAGASGAVPRSTRPVTRLTGGGLPTATYQSTATSNQRRQQLANPPPRTTHVPRRFREIEWIMKPSKNFVQCSESSSEDVPKASELQQLHVDEPEKRAAATTSDSSTSSSGNRNARLQSQQPLQLENLHPLTIREQKEQVSHLARARNRASRVFCVPSQRIMHVEELKQAQLRQMQPRKMSSRSPNGRSPTRSIKGFPERKMKSPNRSPSRSPNRSLKGLIPERKMKSRSPSRSPTRSLKASSPERKMRSPPSRSPTRSLKASSPERRMKSPNSRSPKGRSPTQSPIREASPRPPFLCRKISARSLDGLPVRMTRTVMRLPRPSDIAPPASPNATPKPSQTGVQEASTSQSQSPVKEELPPSWPCTSPPSPHPSSSSNSSLSTSGTECSCERDAPDPPYRPMPGTRAIKLTSTVIKIMPDRRSSSHVSRKGKIKHHSRCKLKAKSHSTFRVGGSKNPAPKLAMPTPMIQPISVFRVGGTKSPTIKLAMNGPMAQAIAPPKVISMVAPLIQSMAPPKHVPKVKVSKPLVSQSVHHVVNQFTDKLTVSRPKVNQSVSRVVSQLTAQLKEAAMIRSFDLPDKRLGLDLASATRSQTKRLDVGRDLASATRSLSRKTSFYLVMDQANHNQFKPKEASSKLDYVIQNMEKVKEQLTTDQRIPSGSERKNPYLSDSQDQVRHNYDIYLKPAAKNVQGKPPPYMQTPSASRNTLNKQPRNPYLNPSEWSRVHSQRTSQSLMSRPVSVNRIPKPRLPGMVPPPQTPQQQQQQEEPLTLAGGKIVRKAQHKVPRTMEDGIDMSYQYFVSIPLKRGKKPQVVRYLYRPMVRQLNPQQHSPSRRSSKRAKRRKAAAAAAAAASAATAAAEAGVDPLSQPELENLDPDLAALGGAPLPLGDPPTVEEEEEEPTREPKPEEIPTVIFDPEAALNSPYKAPPLKLKSRYKPLLEELEQMPYPEERSPPSRRRRPRRQARAAGGSELSPSPEYEDQSVLGISGGGDEHFAKKDERRHKAGGASSGPPKRRAALVNYQAKPTCLGTATGVPISYHQPMFITHKLASEDEPMIQTVTYEHIQQEEMEKEQLEREQREREQLEKDEQLREQQELDRLEREQLERQLKLELEMEEQRQKAKSVSFHPLPVFGSRETTSEPSSSSISVSSSHSSSITVVVASGSRSPKAKSKKGKAKKRKGKGKGKGRK